MNRKPFYLCCLLTVFIISGCAAPPYRVPAPQPTRPIPQQPAGRRHAPPAARPAQQPQPLPRQSAPVNPIAVDINQQAGRLVQSGQLDAAAQALERGLRIAPKDASLWSHLAAVRLRQGHYRQAGSLAAKSNSLAAGNMAVIQNNQRIIEAAQRGGQE